MATIRRVEFTYRKRNLRHDPEKNVWIGWQIDVRVGKRRLRTVFPTRKEAQDFIDELQRQRIYSQAGLKYQRSDIPRLSEVLDRRLEKIPSHKERVRAKRIFECFRSLEDVDPLITEVRPSLFQLFINRRKADGVRPETINREINVLSSAFRTAPELFPVALEDYEPPRVIRPRFRQRRRERIITAAENARILEWLYTRNVRIARMWHLSWLLGLRFSEVARLVVSDFNREQRTLRVVRWKTDTMTLFDHLPQEAIELLAHAVDDATESRLFPQKPTETFYRILKEAVEQAGLTWGRESIDGVTFHSLRHSFITRLVQVTDLATAASLSGHTQGSEMIALYSHASSDTRRAAMQAMYDRADEKKMREVFDAIVSGNMSFREFVEAVT